MVPESSAQRTLREQDRGVRRDAAPPSQGRLKTACSGLMPNNFLELQTARGRPRYKWRRGQEERLGTGSRGGKGAHLRPAHGVRETALMKEALKVTACSWFAV